MIPASVRIFVCTRPHDMRCSYDTLALAAQKVLGQDPRSGALFVFTNKRHNRLKVLWWDHNGYCLLSKRLHQALFRLPVPPGSSDSSVLIDGRGLAELLHGVASARTSKAQNRSWLGRADRYDGVVQAAPITELEARLSELSQERDHFRKLYLETLERCALLERGIIAGNKAERFTANGSQLTLGVLGLLLTPEAPEAAPEAPPTSPASPDESTSPTPQPPRRRPTGRRAITAMLPRVDIEVLPPEVQREGLDAFERIGEEVSEVVEHRPASLVLVRIVRPKFVRKRVAEVDDSADPDVSPVLIAEPPERPIERGLAGLSLLAKTIVYRWQDHLPLYRQEKIHARDGLELARSTMCGWHEQLADLAEPLVDAMLRDAFTQPYLCVDATGVLVQAEEQCRRAHFWVQVAPGRHVLYRYSHKHDSEAVDRLPTGYKGHPVADAHSVYDHLYRSGDVVEVGCWAHCRRYFYKALGSDPARAEHALSLIRGLYRLERPVQTATRKKREEVRRQKSRPLVRQFSPGATSSRSTTTSPSSTCAARSSAARTGSSSAATRAPASTRSSFPCSPAASSTASSPGPTSATCSASCPPGREGASSSSPRSSGSRPCNSRTLSSAWPLTSSGPSRSSITRHRRSPDRRRGHDAVGRTNTIELMLGRPITALFTGTPLHTSS